MSVSTVLLNVAFILAVLAAFGVPSSRVNLHAVSFAFFLLSILVGTG